MSAEALRKRYPGSDEPALDEFDLSMPPGTVHMILAPAVMSLDEPTTHRYREISR